MQYDSCTACPIGHYCPGDNASHACDHGADIVTGATRDCSLPGAGARGAESCVSYESSNICPCGMQDAEKSKALVYCK